MLDDFGETSSAETSAEADLIGRLLSHDPKDRLRVEDATRWKDLVGFHVLEMLGNDFEKSIIICSTH